MRVAIAGLMIVFAALAAGLAGTFKGNYSGSAGASGEIVVSLAQAASGEWKAEVTFMLNGDEVKGKMTSVAVEGVKVKLVYQFDVQGIVLESTATGELKGATIEGTYSTKAVADGSGVDEGTWKAVQAQ